MRLIPVLVLVSAAATAQKLDSLLNRLATANHDTTRLLVLDAIIEDQTHDYSAIEKYSVMMRELSTKNAEGATGELKNFFLHYQGTAFNNLASLEEKKKTKNPRTSSIYIQFS